MDIEKGSDKDLRAGNESANSNLADHAHELLNQAKPANQNNCTDILKKDTPRTLEQLSHANNETLSCLYSSSQAGRIPAGDTQGKAMFMPGTAAGDLISKLGNTVWSGKVFQEDGGLVNKIFGHNLVKADVHKGTSWFDGKESIIIDYKGKSLAAGWVRDEIREVQPGLYLGRMYARLPFHLHNSVLFFALDTNKK